jgi:DNA (cytosine-5)-methyltransferase 1
VLEHDVDDKYFLSEKMINYLQHRKNNFNNGEVNYRDENDYATSITSSSKSLDISDNILRIKSATSKGYEQANDGDSINLKNINSETRRGRVGKGVAQTIESNNMSQFAFNKGEIRRLTPRECFRLMDFPDIFTWKVSDSQAYKQAGNSIVVNVLYKILKQLPL